MLRALWDRLRGWRRRPPTQSCNCANCVASRADAKSRMLLREWLSPGQLLEYERTGSFEVVGSKTGKRYRIEQDRQQNIFELDGRGRPLRGWCFMPGGGLAIGDVMLAQKIALETDEEAVMKVALSFWGEMALGAGFMRYIDDLRWALPCF